MKDRGMIRVKSVTHHKLGESSPPSSYTIMDMAVSLYFILYIYKTNFVSILTGVFGRIRTLGKW